VETHGLARQKIHWLPNAVDLEPAQANRLTWRRRLGLDESQFVACMLGNLHANKDHATLLHAWREVIVREGRNGWPPVLLLAGRWDNRANSLCVLAQELELFQEVRFLGAVGDVSGLLAAADLAVFSSRREGCPNGVLEAMATGLPVVATDIPGTRDALGSDAGECLVPAGDSAAMANRILRLFSDPGLRTREGKKNALRVESEFAPDRSWRAMADLIGGTLQRS
jgi:glycosyltransferase involved in cell wall biosynthesis